MNAHSRKKRRDSNLRIGRDGRSARNAIASMRRLRAEFACRGVTLATIHEEGESLRRLAHADHPWGQQGMGSEPTFFCEWPVNVALAAK